VRRANRRRGAEELRRSEDDVRRRVREKVTAHGLGMKVSDAEWQWDRNKLTVYFTAERRVDFRSLVRELASQFRTRIELRQIGVRDEAAGVRCRLRARVPPGELAPDGPSGSTSRRTSGRH
jgi:cell fate regulator YaaT (PSP1 superfamily)